MTSSIINVDCAIITVLEEEMKLFLENFKKDVQIVEQRNNYTLFRFCDKDDFVRDGIIYNIGKHMGNSEACRLMYEFTRKYSADIYINIGVSCGLNDVNIGDVIFIETCSSLSEKNSTKSELQQTDLNYNPDFITSEYNNLPNSFQREFEKYSNDNLQKIQSNLSAKLNNKKSPIKQKEKIISLFSHEKNEIILGECVTVPYVVKDKDTYQKIVDKARKANVLDMEAYYLALWHQIIQKNEPTKIDSQSKFIMFKSPSDNGIDTDKKLLESIGTRKLSMANLAFVTQYFINNSCSFHSNTNITVPDYMQETFSISSVDSLPDKYEDREAFNKLCPFIIKNLENTKINDYFDFAVHTLSRRGAVLALDGPTGMGKSTFMTYLYLALKEDNDCIYIDISKIMPPNGENQIDTCLYFLNRMMKSGKYKNVVLLIDGIGNDMNISTQAQITLYNKLSHILLQQSEQRISICINESVNNQKIREAIPALNPDATLSFDSSSVDSDDLASFVMAFYEFYKNIVSLEESFTNNVLSLISSSRLQYIDFRLLKMFADQSTLLANSKKFEDFIFRFCSTIVINNAALYELANNIFDKEIGNDSKSITEKESFDDIRNNIYTKAYMISVHIWNLCNKNLSYFNSHEFFISPNIKMFLIYCIQKSERTSRNKTITNILIHIQRDSLSHSAITQLLYIIGSVYNSLSITNQNLYQKISSARLDRYMSNNDLSCADILEFRSLAIIMSICGIDDKYLSEFNLRMINNEKNNYLSYNAMFDFWYYSQKCFSFSQIENSPVNEVDESQFWYTYNIVYNLLEKGIKAQNSFDSQFLMHYITMLYLYRDHICKQQELSHVKEECLQLISQIHNVYSNSYSSNFKQFYNSCMNS